MVDLHIPQEVHVPRPQRYRVRSSKTLSFDVLNPEALDQKAFGLMDVQGKSSQSASLYGSEEAILQITGCPHAGSCVPPTGPETGSHLQVATAGAAVCSQPYSPSLPTTSIVSCASNRPTHSLVFPIQLDGFTKHSFGPISIALEAGNFL